MKRFFIHSVATSVILLFALTPASAQTFDLFQTDPSQHPSVNLSHITGLSPSTVSFQGVPIDSQSCLGNTDTIIQRTDASGGLHPTAFALIMKSVNDSTNPVRFNGTDVDVYVTVNGGIDQNTIPTPDNPLQTAGDMTIGSDGTFSSTLNVNPDIILVPAGTPQNQLNSNIITSSTDDSFKTTLSATGQTSSTPPSGYPNCAAYPAGGIYVTNLVHTAPTHVHQVVPACTPNTTSVASTGGGPSPVPVCATALTPASTSTRKTATKPQ